MLQFAKFTYYEQEEPSEYYTFVYLPEYKNSKDERYFKMMMRVVTIKKLNKLKKGVYSPEVRKKKKTHKKKRQETSSPESHPPEPRKEYIGIQFLEIQIDEDD